MSKLRFRVVETAFKKKPVAVAVPTERNAIRIIEMCGYPKEVVGEAYRLAKKHVL